MKIPNLVSKLLTFQYIVPCFLEFSSPPFPPSTMDDALQLCGFNADTSRFLIDQGFSTPNDLLLATESELDAIARDVSRTPPRGGGNISMPFIAMKHLKGFRFGPTSASGQDTLQTPKASRKKMLQLLPQSAWSTTNNVKRRRQRTLPNPRD